MHISTVHAPDDPRIYHRALQSLVAAGWGAVLIAPAAEPPPAQVIALAPPRRRLTRFLVTAPTAVAAAWRRPAALYHIHDPELLPWAWLLRLRGRPILYDIHEDLVTALAQKSYLPRPVAAVLARLAGPIEAALARPFRQIIAEDYYQRRFPRAVAIRNYPSLAGMPTAPAGAPASRAVLYTGNVTPDRGAWCLAALARARPDFQVTVLGRCSPHLASALQHHAGASLVLNGSGGHVPFAHILAAYCQGGWLAGLALFPDTPHYREKKLTKFFEYMAAGLPIVASDMPTWRRLIHDQGVGLCVPAGDTTAVADALDWLRAHPEAARTMAARGQALAAAHYNWDLESRRLLAIYAGLV